MHCRLSLLGLTMTTLTPSYSGRQAQQPARGRLEQGDRNLAGDVAGGDHWSPRCAQQPVGSQPSRFLVDRAEAERAFQLAEELGSVNAAAAELGTTWPSLRKAFTRHGLGMPTRNPEAVRQRAMAAASRRTGQPATPGLDPVFASRADRRRTTGTDRTCRPHQPRRGAGSRCPLTHNPDQPDANSVSRDPLAYLDSLPVTNQPTCSASCPTVAWSCSSSTRS
jgi:hypothetical protein